MRNRILGRYFSLKDPRRKAEALRVLGLGEGATQAQIRARYTALSKKLHPDVSDGDSSKEFQKVIDSYLFLRSLNQQPAEAQSKAPAESGQEREEPLSANLQQAQQQILEKYKEIFGEQFGGNCAPFFQASMARQTQFVQYVEMTVRERVPGVHDLDYVFPLYGLFRDHINRRKNGPSQSTNDSNESGKNAQNPDPQGDFSSPMSQVPKNSLLASLMGFGTFFGIIFWAFRRKEAEDIQLPPPEPLQSSPTEQDPNSPVTPPPKRPFIRLKPPSNRTSRIRKFRLVDTLNDFVIAHSLARDIELYVAKNPEGIKEAHKALSKNKKVDSPNFQRIVNNSYACTINLALISELILKNVFVPVAEVRRQLEVEGHFRCPIIHFYYARGNILLKIPETNPLVNGVDLRYLDSFVSLFDLYFGKNSELIYLSEFTGGFKLSKCFEIRKSVGVNGLIQVRPQDYRKRRLFKINYSKPYYYDYEAYGALRHYRPTDWKRWDNMDHPKYLQWVPHKYRPKQTKNYV